MRPGLSSLPLRIQAYPYAYKPTPTHTSLPDRVALSAWLHTHALGSGLGVIVWLHTHTLGLGLRVAAWLHSHVLAQRTHTTPTHCHRPRGAGMKRGK